MKIHRLAPLILAVLLQCVPVTRAVLARGCIDMPAMAAILRMLTGATAVAGSLHAVSGASVTILSPPAGSVLATNGVFSPFRIDVNYFDGTTTHIASIYDATNLPPGFNPPTKSGAIWRITGTPTQSGVFSNVWVTAYDDINREGTNKATVALSITVVDALPSISKHPAGFSVNAGTAGELSVQAAGGSLQYRWLKGDLEVEGQTNDVLSFESLTPGDAGIYRVEIRNGAGSVLSDPAEVIVIPVALPPVFTTVPQSLTVHEGESFTLVSVATSDEPITFGWTHNDLPVENEVNGNLAFPSASASNAGRYVVIATAPLGGSTHSPVAEVTVVGPLRLVGPMRHEGGFHMTFNGIPGRSYLLESATNLIIGGWQTVTETVASAESGVSVPQPGEDLRWYRIRPR